MPDIPRYGPFSALLTFNYSVFYETCWCKNLILMIIVVWAIRNPVWAIFHVGDLNFILLEPLSTPFDVYDICSIYQFPQYCLT